MTRRSHRLAPLAAALILAGGIGLAAAPGALAVGADRLASEIELNLTGIASMARIQPERAREQLEDQIRLFELLRNQRPDHPMLEELEAELERLSAEVAEAIAEDDLIMPADDTEVEIVPLAVSQGLAELDQLMEEAETFHFQGEKDLLAERIETAQAKLDQMTDEHGDDIPPAYSPLLVAEERLSLLRDQLRQLERD
jgi:hypothetical protein